jgi:hypothetical protein
LLAALLHGGLLQLLLGIFSHRLCAANKQQVGLCALLQPEATWCMPNTSLLRWPDLPCTWMPAFILQVLGYLREIRRALGAVHQQATKSADELETLANQMPASINNILGNTFAASLEQHLRQPARQLHQALNAFDSSLAPLMHRVALLRDEALPPAQALAQHLLQLSQQRPGQLADARLLLAQADATRCCAYLRCAQLDAQGGPAAGEGVGSKRCSGCRTAWYCGAACQNADWRAGHNKVCKALTGLRAQQQQQDRSEAP